MSGNWYFDKMDLLRSPSALDNIDYATEVKYRIAGARFIIETGASMDLGYNTTATGVVYFHRFYMFQSFKNFPHYVTACCCLYLAGKVEETPKRCHDIIKAAKNSLSEKDFATFGHNPKEEVMTLERILLQTIKFDLQVEHPYGYLLKYAKCLRGEKEKLEKMVQMAWTFVNDSLSTTLCLQWEPEIIAIALMYLAGKLSKFEVADWKGRTAKHLKWWDMFVEGITIELIEDICHQVLDLYSTGQPLAKVTESSPTVNQFPKQSLPPASPAFKSSSTPNGMKPGPNMMIGRNGKGTVPMDMTRPPPPLPMNQVLTQPPPLLRSQVRTPPPPAVGINQAHTPKLMVNHVLTPPPPPSLVMNNIHTPPPPFYSRSSIHS